MMRFVKLSHKMASCEWDDDAKKWCAPIQISWNICLWKARNLLIENLKTGEILRDDADILLSARGNLNDISWPKIPGFNSFQGEVMHSAQWNQESVFQDFFFIVVELMM